MRMQERAVQWLLTGRESELNVFTVAWANPHCKALVISGPAGVGKTRLAEECLARAVRGGYKGGQAAVTATAAAIPLGAIAHLVPAGVDLSDPVKGFAAAAAALSGPPHKQRRWALWVDDLHLLDATSAVLLRQLMDSGVVRLIGTIRTGEPVTAAMKALTHGDTAHWIDLSTFSQEQTGAVLQAALGGPVARRTMHELHVTSGGNALYLRELVLGALQAGVLASDGEIWELAAGRSVGTPRLAKLIGARLAATDLRARPILELLALAEPIALADAQQITSLGVLTTLEEAGLIDVVTDQRRTTVRLAHPLYGEVLRAGIPVLRRSALLMSQAERIQSYGARRRDDALHIATWHLASAGTADPALLVRSSGLARHTHDYPHVVTLLEALPEEDRTTGTDLMLGDAFFEMGHWDQAEAVFARTDATATSEADTLAVTPLRTANLLWSNAPFTQALAVNNGARSRVTSAVGRQMLQVNEGYMRIAAGQPIQGLALLEDLETDPGRAPNINIWLAAALMKSIALPLIGHTREAVDWADHTYTAHRQMDKHALVSHPAVQRVPLVLALTEAGRIADALVTGTRAYTELATDGSVVRVWLAAILGRAQWLAGHPIMARHWWAEAAALARTINHAMVLRLVVPGLAACAALIGDLPAAETAMAEHRTLPHIPPGVLSAGEESLGDAWLHAAHGRLGQARTVLTEAVAIARETGHLSSEMLLLTDIARLGGAGAVQARLAELAGKCDGALAPARAHLAAALAANDPKQLIAAADELEAIGADLLAAEVTSQAAAAWQRAGEARRATAAAQRAQMYADRCQDVRTPLLTTALTITGLTTREREIALLAVAGNPSKDIADTLHLSVRTVDNHLQRAYAKLGVTSRRELARVLREQYGSV